MQHFAGCIKRNQEPSEFSTKFPITLLRGEANKADDIFFDPAIMALFLVFEGLKYEEVPNSCFEGVEFESLFEKVFWRGQVGEESTPGPEFGFPGALYYDVKILPGGKRCLEEGDDDWKEGPFPDNWFVGFVGAAFVVYFLVEDVVEENF